MLCKNIFKNKPFSFFAESAGAGFLSLFPDGLLFGNNHLLLQLTKVALNYSSFQWSRINTKLTASSLVVLAGEQSNSQVQAPMECIGCHSQDRWVFFRGFHGGCVGVEQFIAVVLAFSHHPIRPSTFPFHWVISVTGAWNRGSQLGGGNKPAMGADFV